MNIGNRTRDTNFVHLVGIITKDFETSHVQRDSRFLRSQISVPRLSGIYDNIPVIIDSKKLQEYGNVSLKDSFIELNGRFCSFAKYDEEDNKSVERYVFVSDLRISDKEKDMEYPVGTNEIFLDGRIEFNPIFRKTPKGRIIAEFSVSCSRKKNRDRVPCVAWGEDAMGIANLGINTGVQLIGRVQSRDYSKNTPEGEINGTAYEVSVRNYTLSESD